MKIRILILNIFLFLLVPGPLFAQKKFQLHLFFQPNIASAIPPFPIPISFKYGFSLGLEGNYFFNKSIWIASGVGLINKGYIYSFDLSSIVLADSDPTIDFYNQIKITYNNLFFRVPFLIGVKVINKNNFYLGLTGGFNLDFLFDRYDYVEVFNSNNIISKKKLDVPIKEPLYNFSIGTGIRFNYFFTNKIGLLVEPTFDITIMEFSKTYYRYPTKYWNLGLKTGISYRF